MLDDARRLDCENLAAVLIATAVIYVYRRKSAAHLASLRQRGKTPSVHIALTFALIACLSWIVYYALLLFLTDSKWAALSRYADHICSALFLTVPIVLGFDKERFRTVAYVAVLTVAAFVGLDYVFIWHNPTSTGQFAACTATIPDSIMAAVCIYRLKSEQSDRPVYVWGGLGLLSILYSTTLVYAYHPNSPLATQILITLAVLKIWIAIFLGYNCLFHFVVNVDGNNTSSDTAWIVMPAARDAGEIFHTMCWVGGAASILLILWSPIFSELTMSLQLFVDALIVGCCWWLCEATK